MTTPKTNPNRRLRLGFSLIELLVVVSIIALLISILLPALAKAKSKADGVTCSANMRSLQQALQLYLTENDSSVPVNGIIFPKNNTCQRADGTTDPKISEPNTENYRVENGALYVELGRNKKPYMCPSDFKANCPRTYVPRGTDTGNAHPTQPLLMDANDLIPNPKDPTQMVPYVFYATLSSDGTSSSANAHKPGDVGQGYWSYSVNAVMNSAAAFASVGGSSPYFPAGLPWANPLKTSSVRNPMFITFIEESADGQYPSPFNDEVMDSPAYNAGDSLSARHDFGGNVAFLDSHVEYFKQTPFDYVPTATGSTANTTALQSDITKMFFPDAGAFALGP